MKRLIALCIILFSITAFGQFKEDGKPKDEVIDGIVAKPTLGSLFGLFDNDSFFMKHSYTLSYSSFAGQGLAMGVYTNSMMLKLASNLNVQVDASLAYSPYNTLNKDVQNRLSGFFISNASVNYHPWKNMYITVQYHNDPYSYYNPYYYGRYGFGMFDRMQNNFQENLNEEEE